MKGYIGTDAHLRPGMEIITGHNLELRVVVVGVATEEEARKSAEKLGHQLVVVPGERFYEVDVTTRPAGSAN